MSSHHIVREKQEPALLIAGLDNFPDELLGQLLEWSPTVVVTAHTAEQVQAYGIKIDWLVANELLPELQQSDIKLVPANGADGATAALDYLIAQGYHAVNMITDEFTTDKFAKYFPQVDLVIFYNEKKIVAVHPGFSKWQPAAERIEILTVPHNFVYTGLVNVGGNVYETVQDGFFSLQFSNAYLLIAGPLG